MSPLLASLPAPTSRQKWKGNMHILLLFSAASEKVTENDLEVLGTDNCN